MSGINASRERIDIIRNLWESTTAGTRSKTTIRCNRMILPLRNKDGDQRTVIRGKSLVGTMRMAIIAMEAFRTEGSLTEPAVVNRFGTKWQESLSKYDTVLTKGNWIAIYVNGAQLYSNAEAPDMDRIETVAHGGVISESMLDGAEARFSDQGEEVHFSYDSQLAVTITNHERYVKCAILERNLVNEGTMSFQFMRKPNARGIIIDTAGLATAIIEGSTLLRQNTQLRKQLVSRGPLSPKEIEQMMGMIRARVTEINATVGATVGANQVQFWPEQPKFVIN